MELISWFKLQWDRIVGVGLMLVGMVLLIVGWIGTSGEVYIANQLPYVISGGLGGLAVLGLGATMWLSADLSDEWRTLDRIDRGPGGAADPGVLADRVRELELRLARLTEERVDGSVNHNQCDRVRT